MIILTGASASGKTSIAKCLIEKYKFQKLITCTTREKRVGEIDDVDYHFLTTEEFRKRMENGNFVETTFYNNHYYGTDKKDIANNKVVILDINGANKFYDQLGDEAIFFFIYASAEKIKERMIQRGDDLKDIKKRLSLDKTYFDYRLMKHIDYMINTDVDDIETITKIVFDKFKEREIKNGI